MTEVVSNVFGAAWVALIMTVVFLGMRALFKKANHYDRR